MRRDVLVVVLVALSCRLAVYGFGVYYDRKRPPVRFAFLNPDARVYNRLALNLARYGVYSESPDPHHLAPAVERGPGYPAAISVVYRIFGPSPHAAILLQIILGSLIAGLVCILGYSLAGRAAGLGAGLLLAVNLPSILYANRLLTETLSSLLLLLAVWAMLLAWRTSGAKSTIALVATGAIAGLSAYVRTATLLWPAVLIVGSAIHYKQFGKTVKSAAWLGLAFLVVLTPWVVRNEVVFGTPQFSSGAGRCLLDWNAAYVVAAEQGISLGEARTQLEEEVRPHLSGNPRALFANSHARSVLAAAVVRGNWPLTVKLFAAGFLRTLLAPVSSPLAPINALLLVRIGLGVAAALGILSQLLALWGLCAMLARPQHFALAALIALSLVYAGAVAALQGHSRFRIPYLPLLMLLAGRGVQAAVAFARARLLRRATQAS